MNVLNKNVIVILKTILTVLALQSNAIAYDFKDAVVVVGDGSGIAIGNKAITARHVLTHMDYKLRKGNKNPVCCVDGDGDGDDPKPIGNFDNYTLAYLPSSNDVDNVSLKSGKIYFDDRISDYNDWAVVNLVYESRPTDLLRFASAEDLNESEPLIAVGNINGSLVIDDSLKFKRMAGNNIIFSYDTEKDIFRPGFSGGGLFKTNGDLVGILFAKSSETGQGAATSIMHIKSELAQSCASIFLD